MTQNTQADMYAELRDVISSGESSGYEKHGLSSAYDAWFGYVKNGAPQKNISEMTIDEVISYQDNLRRATQGMVKLKDGTYGGTSAVGKYQFLQDTLKETAQKLGLRGDEKFSPEIQDRLADSLIDEAGGAQWKIDKNDNAFRDKLASKWASVAKSDGNGYYSGQKATVGVDATSRVFDNMRSGTPYAARKVEQVTVSGAIPEGAMAAPASKVENMVRPEGLVASNGKWYLPKEGPKSYTEEGFKKGSAQFNFQTAIDKLSGSENEQDKDMLQKILKIKEEMGDKAGIDLTRENDNIDWKWKDQSQRDKRWSGVAKEDKSGPFGGKKALGASGAKYEDALNYMIQNNHLTYDKGDMVADLDNEYKDFAIIKDAEEAPLTFEDVLDTRDEFVKEEDTKIKGTVLDEVVVNPATYIVKQEKKDPRLSKIIPEITLKPGTTDIRKEEIVKTKGVSLPKDDRFSEWENRSNAEAIERERKRLELHKKIKEDDSFIFTKLAVKKNGGELPKYFLGGLLAAAGKAIIPMAKEALPSVIGALGGSKGLGDVMAGAIKVKPTEGTSEGTSDTANDVVNMPEESLMKLVERIKGLLGTPVQGIAKSTVVSAKFGDKLPDGTYDLTVDTLPVLKPTMYRSPDITGVKPMLRRDEIVSGGITNLMKASIPKNLGTKSKLNVAQVTDGAVKEQSGLEKMVNGVDLNALTRFAFSKPVRSKPVHLQVSPYRPMVIRNPETGTTTEQQRLAEQELADQMQIGTNNNPDDVRTSIAKARSLSEYRGKVETGKAQNKIATEGAFTAAVNQDNAQKSAHEQKVQQIDYANRSADEQADMQYDLLQQKREGQLVADTLSSRGNIANAERTMDYQVANAQYVADMRETKEKAQVALNSFQAATDAKRLNPTDAATESAYNLAKTAYETANAVYKAEDERLRAKMMAIQRKSATNTAGYGTVGSYGMTFKAGGSLEKAKLKAAVYRERTELKNAIDENKLAERRAMNAYKIYRDTTAIVKKSNEALVKAYFKKY